MTKCCSLFVALTLTSVPFCAYSLTDETARGGERETKEERAQDAIPRQINTESDQIGFASDTFYRSASLNDNGRWVQIGKWGRCWQPTNVAEGWRPYTDGTWRVSEDYGWTFVSSEPWAWACYHYGRWCKVRTGCGWAWVPGKVWAASWVSWRRGRDESCSCIGWAPLPPDASCELNVGISTWVDRTCEIGPDYYTFVNIRDFGSDSYLDCGCIYENSRNVGIIQETINITNLCYNRDVTYCGGPDFKWCNERIRTFGGKEVARISIKRFDKASKMEGGRVSNLKGNQLALFSPHLDGEKNPKHVPKAVERMGQDKIDKGWESVKDKKQKKKLRNYIATESEGRTPRNTKATLPNDVAHRMGKRSSDEAPKEEKNEQPASSPR